MELPPSAAGLPALAAHSLPSTVLDAVRQGRAGTAASSAYLYDPAVAAGNAAALRECLPDWAEICYAIKANGFPPVLDALLAGPRRAEPATSGQPGLGIHGFEVSSTSEVRHALAAFDRAAAERAAVDRVGSRRPGVASSRRRLVSSGPAKSAALLTALAELPDAAQHVDAVINVESAGELRRLEDLAARLGRRVTVALRVNPRQVHLAGSLRMGGRPSAFGIPEPEVPAVLELAGRLPHLDVAGFHVHAVAANLDALAHLDYVRWCLDFAIRTARTARMELRVVDVGGGFGVPFEPDRRDERPFALARFGEGLDRLRIPADVRVIFEPGRLLVADCGWYTAEVIDVKHSYGTDFVVLRGGIHHFALPISWEIVHNFAVVRRGGTAAAPVPSAPRAVTVVGELCTPEDTLARDITVDSVRPGDVVVFPMAGAYGYEFALTEFLGHARPRRVVLALAPADETSGDDPGGDTAIRAPGSRPAAPE